MYDNDITRATRFSACPRRECVAFAAILLQDFWHTL